MSTITTILGTDQPVNSRTVINNNFANLNSTKKEDSMSTNKLLGRNTTGTGVIEEITLGTGLSMTGTTINVTAGAGDMLLGTSQIVTALKTFLDATFGIRNVANTFTSFFTNANTASRTYTLKDANGTLAFTSDITGTNSGTNTGDETTARINTLYGATVPTISSTNTITNKRNTKRILTVTQSATPATNTDNGDIISITAIAQNITSMTSSLTGTPVNGDMIMWQFTATGSFTLAWGTSFASTASYTLPTAISTTMIRVLTQWNSVTSKHECIGNA